MTLGTYNKKQKPTARCLSGSAAPLRLIVVGVSPAWGGADTHFYGQFWAQTRPKLPGADAFLPVLWNRYVVEEIATIKWGDTACYLFSVFIPLPAG